MTGRKGAGAVFFTRCNLRCVYCQNHQISQGFSGRVVTPHELADVLLELQRLGCSNIEAVSPSHHLPGLLEALAIAVDNGLDIPVVYNTNAYESLETLDILDGVVDMYLPDLKYAREAAGLRYSDAPDYVERARAAILAMHAQVGNLVVDTRGCGVRGLIVRHLVLPGDVSGTAETLAWLSNNLSKTVTVSLMAQYVPLHRSAEYPPLDWRITAEEYDRGVDVAWDLGMENVFIQDLESQDVGVPDFSAANPFVWNR